MPDSKNGNISSKYNTSIANTDATNYMVGTFISSHKPLDFISIATELVKYINRKTHARKHIGQVVASLIASYYKCTILTAAHDKYRIHNDICIVNCGPRFWSNVNGLVLRLTGQQPPRIDSTGRVITAHASEKNYEMTFSLIHSFMARAWYYRMSDAEVWRFPRYYFRATPLELGHTI